MVKKVQVRVYLQAQELSPEAVLANYLNSKKTLYPLKDMVMIALKSYWLPWAYRDNSLVQQSVLDSCLRDCIHRLQLQIQELQEMLVTQQVENTSCSTECSDPTAISTKPEVTLSTKVVKKFQIRFQVQAEAGSAEIILLDYLNSRQAPYPFEDMVITALKSFWLPKAHHHSNPLFKSRGDKVIRECISRLQLQSRYLQSMLLTVDVENDLTLVTGSVAEVIAECEALPKSEVLPQSEVSDSETEVCWDPYEEDK